MGHLNHGFSRCPSGKRGKMQIFESFNVHYRCYQYYSICMLRSQVRDHITVSINQCTIPVDMLTFEANELNTCLAFPVLDKTETEFTRKMTKNVLKATVTKRDFGVT